ncbi:MAG: insulinase family protein [Crocinitomicaceae bacterium]|nr:insulinase family protein [Crocinitomicaceae bacterium]
MKKLFLGIIAGCVSLSSMAQQKIEFVEYDLPNGIHVILHQEKSTPIVAVSVLYHVGSKNEKPDRTGFAHFFEHLLFEGSANIGRGEYSQYVEKNGGALNANTSMDRTFYFELLPSNQLELGLWLESERMLHAKVDSVGIETQRSVVKEEKRQRIDNQPYATFIKELFDRLFPNSTYGWQPIGSMEHLDAAQEEDYVNFYQTYYVPANATISIAGDIDIAQTKKWIDKYFKSIPKGQAINLYRDFLSLKDDAFKSKYGVDKSIFDSKDFFNSKNAKAKAMITEYTNKPTVINRPAKPTEKPKTAEVVTIYDNIQLPALFVGYVLPEQTNEDMYALEFLNSVLSGSSSSRINKELVEKKQLATMAFSFAYGLENAGAEILAAIASKDASLDEILKELDAQIEKVQNELITQEEFEKVRNQFENQAVTSYSTISGIGEALADAHVYRGSANYVNDELGKYLKVTREDIQRVAKKYFTKDARVILHYLPKEDKESK